MTIAQDDAAQGFRLKLPLQESGRMGGALPTALLVPGSRAGDGVQAQLLGNVRVKRSWLLAPASRSDEAPQSEELSAEGELLALEATDGTTIFMRADALVAQLRRSRPELVDEDGAIDFARFRDERDTSRGALGWIWRQITELEVTDDAITEEARGELGEQLGASAAAWASRRGATALMKAIENRLAGEPGLYRWDGGLLEPGDRCAAGDSRLLAAAQAGPLLVFIHGTGSHTLGGFGDLPGSSAWAVLAQAYEQRIYGLEHRTFSESPIDNALALAAALPSGARLHLVTHSRGGLVGDLMCLDPASETLGELFTLYRRAPRPDEIEAERRNPALAREREQGVAGEQAKLRQLMDLMREKKLRVERYVRVAAPARGTALLSDSLDVFLSGLLNLVRKFGAWSAGAAVGAVATPAVGLAAKKLADTGLAFLSRVVLEIADKRLQAQVIPGIEAMLPEAPMGMLLGRADIAPTVKMAVIAGDIDGVGAGYFQRIGVMFVDWAFFDRARNDLVVDTGSMYGGLVARAAQARAIFVQGPQVNHFRYFRDEVKSLNVSLPMALCTWLLEAAPESLRPWETLNVPELEPPTTGRVARGEAEPANDTMPVLILLPGIMGSHLRADGDRVWLDPLGLVKGHLPRIALGSGRSISTDGLVAMSYGKLADYLEGSHRVIRHAYDWRLPIRELGENLAKVVQEALDAHPHQPVRLLAHSMGGLVARAAFAADPELWPKLVGRPGGRLLMLGTPNHGSHAFVETLLGQAGTVRMLARVDVRHGLQQVLDVVAGFPGALHLLPAPGFEDTGGPALTDFYQAQSWTDLARINDDFWFGRNLGGRPAQAMLKQARDFWLQMADTSWLDSEPDRVAYVYGKGDNTPCGLQLNLEKNEAAGVRMLGTPNGDGSVTWQSGRLPRLPDERYWYMPVDHGGLVGTPQYFGEIAAMLAKGVPEKLGRLPVSRSEEARAPLISYRAGPPPAYPTDQELVARMLGSRIKVLPSRKQAVLQVMVKAMDLRFVQVPIMCGHYQGDPIAGAEAVIDRSLVKGALSHRQRLGIHSGEMGEATVVLMPRTAEDNLRKTGRGALVVGLGEMGKLSADGVSQAVRTGALRYLLHAYDRYSDEWARSPAGIQGDYLPLRLASLLIGTNSSAQLEVAEAVKAVVLGVLAANRDFALGAAGPDAHRVFIAHLEFVEVFRDAAISAAYAVGDLDKNLASELKRLDTRLEVASELQYGEGVRQRLSVNPFSDYWPRLLVGDADRDESNCPPECYRPRLRNPVPAQALRQILALYGVDKADGALLPAGLDNAPIIRQAERLRFTYMGEKARAEVVVQQHQPGLLEKLVDASLKGPGSTSYVQPASFGNTLFQLLVPLELKGVARKVSNLILMVDESTANLPWEMLEADGQPMVRRTRVVRQFLTASYRRDVIRTSALTACVIANPSTQGYYTQFGGAGWKPEVQVNGQEKPDRLPSLEGASREGKAVADVLESAGYATGLVPPDALAGDVFTKLFQTPYRVLVIAAHGIFGKRGADGLYRSGVVLSDGLLLSAVEIGLMEMVPDLVFLSCCHLGKTGADDERNNRLAASLSRELINMGVRCVVAAGWEVRDDAAQTFAETFFTSMAVEGMRFGDAIHAARMATLDGYPDCNTWGAYQAYGDPAFQLKLLPAGARSERPLLALEELLDWLEQLRLTDKLPGAGRQDSDFKALVESVAKRLRTLPPSWAEHAEVQHALGRLYSEYGSIGFAQARKALLRSIAEDSSHGLVPVSAIEQLINIEARQADQLSEPGSAQDLAAAQQLLDGAIARATALLTLASPQPAGSMQGDTGLRANLERQAILGSAYKRKAGVLVRAGKDWSQVRPVLLLARQAYASGDGEENAPDWNPYARINRLQLDALLGQGSGEADAALRCQEAARARFLRSYGFFDAVMAADAALTGWLLDGQLPGLPAGPVATPTARALDQIYQDALQGLEPSVRQFDSVFRQLELLARFLRLRGEPGDSGKAAALAELAALVKDRADPRAGSGGPPAATGQGSAEPAAEVPAPAPAKARRTRPRKPVGGKGGGQGKAS